MNVFPDLSPIGFVQKTYGFNGQVQVQLEVDIVDKHKTPPFIWLLQYGKPVPFKVLGYKIEGAKKVTISFEDIKDESEALALKGLSCFIEESIYDIYFELTESYNYIMDFEVIDKTDGALGIVVDVLENDNGHDNLVVQKDTIEILIPFVDHIVLAINEDKQEIQVDLPEGLLELFTD